MYGVPGTARNCVSRNCETCRGSGSEAREPGPEGSPNSEIHCTPVDFLPINRSNPETGIFSGRCRAAALALVGGKWGERK